ncbi:unnamed protein product [Diatraea saccharalis]|uniref:GON-4-like protein n=1 Tax=Diatraea saccharalis TaxID=40085 RepID=A0A9N9RDF9_9NEOP|nr:unnamed protein product [Diatraea saccharalis]
MLPSMPVLFSRESQDAFGNKIEPSTSFFSANLISKPPIKPEPPPPPYTITTKEPVKSVQKEPKGKGNTKKKDDPPNFDNNAIETALVKSYYAKVQSQFSSNPSVPNNKFIQFQNILKTFDPTKETPVELYRKIERLCGDEHKDILEDFLLFLKPGQAAKVGRFMDHFMMEQLNGFIELLHRTFYRKPTILRKILRALTTGLNSGSSEQMKTRVLPHLRSNPRLIQLFKSLFPDERPPDSAYENATDTINESFLTADNGYDVWEFQEDTNNKWKRDVKEGLDTMYLHGRVFLQHGRLLRSASVTYPYSKEPYRVHARRLAPSHCHLSPPDSGDERSTTKRPNRSAKSTPKKTKKPPKSPTKNAKDVNDNTKLKDCAVTNALTSKSPKIKSQNIKKTCKDKDSNKNNRKDSKGATCQKKDTKQAKVETRVPEMKAVETKNTSWTRDEDKTMLQVIKCEADSEIVFGRIGELLPHRSVSEIKERFCHVMSLLQQMAVGEVT